jgi:hypothetical protein
MVMARKEIYIHVRYRFEEKGILALNFFLAGADVVIAVQRFYFFLVVLFIFTL